LVGNLVILGTSAKILKVLIEPITWAIVEDPSYFDQIVNIILKQMRRLSLQRRSSSSVVKSSKTNLIRSGHLMK